MASAREWLPKMAARFWHAAAPKVALHFQYPTTSVANNLKIVRENDSHKNQGAFQIEMPPDFNFIGII